MDLPAEYHPGMEKIKLLPSIIVVFSYPDINHTIK
jgi:hypothetical protein